MVQSLQLGASSQADDQKGMRRLNRLPIIVAIIVIVLFVGVVVIGLSWRGLSFNRSNDIDIHGVAKCLVRGSLVFREIRRGMRQH